MPRARPLSREYSAHSGGWKYGVYLADLSRLSAASATGHGVPKCGTPLEDDEIVPVDELGLGDVAEDGLDFAGRLAQDARGFRRTVVDESARDLAPVGSGHAHDFAALERSVDGGGADGEQALAAVEHRFHRARIERHAARWLEMIGEPLLARGDRRRGRGEERADRLSAEQAQQHVGF